MGPSFAPLLMLALVVAPLFAAWFLISRFVKRHDAHIDSSSPTSGGT